MRSYQIYSIENEVADYYYGRERMFYDLFLQYLYVSGSLKEIIRKQINYITKPFPILNIHHLLNQSFLRKSEMIWDGEKYLSKRNSSENGVELQIREQMLILHAWGHFDSESIFLEALKKYDGRLLAIDIENERFGWIKPLKERKFV
ncbi:sporulation inhibitor of replication protein SirA [Bacillus sp. FJAT-49736]|uniref:sporulation inhibitor of replication protein SirA n=1 Tax=Bacillus sp. FJAT-49736 TaxID=2833582 RepID=UPI001BC9038E|nr:sporulation inhibitor of replication protein SirA [Bacillus sp. FJAT-49736]MBS4172622.1 sporulation inhibitor of replication protein SirA [Bacillus sp. FJAT-49736]